MKKKVGVLATLVIAIAIGGGTQAFAASCITFYHGSISVSGVSSYKVATAYASTHSGNSYGEVYSYVAAGYSGGTKVNYATVAATNYVKVTVGAPVPTVFYSANGTHCFGGTCKNS